MTNDTVLRVEGVSKKFCKRLRHSMYYGTADVARGMLGLEARTDRVRPGEFWAVEDVSFELKRGETLGIVGPNGSGKTTLLRLLSGIYHPDKGRISIMGRVVALVAVGAGFHPLMTGRENVYLNGTILGMSKREIDQKFDSIVDFADIGEFIDAPVKNYSSGMYVRLGFAVAAHIEPDILVVDEILAVGDAAFQKKCTGKMRDISREGRTVLFVSHNMATVRQLCKRAIVLEKGRVTFDGPSADTVSWYLRSDTTVDFGEVVRSQLSRLPEDPAIKLHGVSVMQDGREGNHAITGKPVEIRVEYEVIKETLGLRVFFVLYDGEGVSIFRSFAHSEAEELSSTKPGRYISRAFIPADFLAPVNYFIGVNASIYNSRRCFPEDVMIPLTVEDAGRIKHAYAYRGRPGIKLAPLIPWETEGVR